MRSTGWILTAWMLLPLVGCASLTDFRYEQTQRSRARSAWHEHGVATMPASYASDYRMGWKDGFYEVATGGKGCPPVVAPCRYWQPAQILEDCDAARHAYYSGFQDGVAAALQYPQTHYLKLWSSCECPLPVCENQCGPTFCCPGEHGGLILQDAFPGAVEFHEAVELNIQECEQMIEVIQEPDSVRAAVPYRIESEPRETASAVTNQNQQQARGPVAKPAASERTETGNASRPLGIEPAEPYHLDVRLRQENVTPRDRTPAEFPGPMIEDDRFSVAPCNLLQYAD